MKVLLMIVLMLFLIGCIPVGVLFRYCSGVELKLTVLFFKIGILPKKPLSRKKQEKADAKKAAKAAKKAEAKAKQKKKKQAQSLIAKPKPEEPAKPPKPLGDKLAELIPWAKLGAKFVGEFFHRKLTVTRLYIRAVLAGGDPAKTALTVGRAWETIGIALPILEQAFRIRDRKLAVYPDFTAKRTDLEAELRIRLRIGGVVLLALKFAAKALALLLRQKREAKHKNSANEPEGSPVNELEETSANEIEKEKAG